MMPTGGRPESKEPFRPSGRQIGGAVIGLLLIVFIAFNNDDAQVNFIFKKVTLPLWLVLAGTALLGVAVGIGIGARRTKRKYMDPG